MKKFLCSTLLIIVSLSLAFGQVQISGSIKDTKGNPLPGVNIFIKDSYDGTSSDGNGFYTFKTSEKGEIILCASYVGFEPFEQKLDIAGDRIIRDIVLKESISSLDVVVISAGSFEASDEKKAVILKPLDIVTTAGGDADIFSVLNTLPGTSTVGEDEGLYVRGGAKHETTYIIDEMVVKNPYFSNVPDIPSRGRFSPFEFKGTVFSTGGYSAQYGQALSSAIILKSQDLSPQTMSSIGILPLAIGGSHVQAWDNTSMSASINYAHLGAYFAIVPQNREWNIIPQTLSGSMSFRQKTSETGILKFYSSLSKSKLGLQIEDLDNPGTFASFGLQNTDIYMNASYKEGLGDDWSLFAGSSYSKGDDDIDYQGAAIQNDNNLLQVKSTITRFVGDYSAIRAGAEWHTNQTDNSYDNLSTTNSWRYAAGFLETDIFISYKMAARLGGRYEYADHLNKGNIAPRISFSYKTGESSQVSLAYGHFYQTPQAEQNEYLYPFYQQLPNLDYENATHYIANYQYLGEKRTFRIEGYYKDYNKLVKYTTHDSLLVINNTGDGYARGFDIFWRDKKTFKNVDYWISYSFLDTKRKYRDYPTEAQPTFAATHNLSLVFKRYFAKLKTSFSATYTYASGRPYFNPNNPEFLADRTQDYHELAASASYLTTILGNFAVVFASVNNILGRDHVFSYRYSTDGTVAKPVRSAAPRTYIIGLFISFNHNKQD